MQENCHYIENELAGILPGALHVEKYGAGGRAVSVHQNYFGENSIGRGRLRYFQVYPGISLMFSCFWSDHYTIRHSPEPSVMHINHCRQGRSGWRMANGMTFYMGPGDLLLHMTDDCCDSEMSLPLGYYEGVSVAADLGSLNGHGPELLREAGINGAALYDKFFGGHGPLVMPASDKIEHIFSELYELPPHIRIPYFKLKVQELLMFLSLMEVPQDHALNTHLSQQVEVIRAIHDRITKNLQRRYTIGELSRQYLMNTSTLKNVFKSVYGLPIASYMKQYRLKQAAQLLKNTDDSIAAVAGKVGYENQSKFTQAFKEQYHVLPTEFRKQYRSEKHTGI